MSKELATEIDEFLSTMDTQEPVEPEPEQPAESPEEPEVVTDNLEEETPETPEAPGEEPEPEVDPLEELRQQNELLQQRLNEAYTQKPKAEEPSAKAEEPKQQDFFGEWKFDDIVESQENLQKFLGEFANKIVSTTRESVLKDLPRTVSNLTTQQMEAQRVVGEFYGEHPKLSSVKPFVAQVVSTVAAEHADWELPQVLEEAATRAYKSLGLKQQVERKEKSTPAFAPTTKGGQRGRDSTPAKSKLEKELEELMMD